MKERIKKLFAALTGRKVRVAAMAFVLLFMFLSGYSTTSGVIRQCNAQIVPNVTPTTITVTGGFCVCCKVCSSPCDDLGTALLIRLQIYAAWYSSLITAVEAIEFEITSAINTMVETFLNHISVMEDNLIDWWDTFWDYALAPSMRMMTKQIQSALADQAKTHMAAVDAYENNRREILLKDDERENAEVFKPAENMCPVATLSTGQGRASGFSLQMRQAYQDEALATGANTYGQPGANAAAETAKVQSDNYEKIFCEPGNSGGNEVCAPVPGAQPNADIRAAEFIYNKLTLRMDDALTGPNLNIAVQALMTNMVGDPKADPITKSVLASSSGQEKFLDRRSYLSRYAAIRAVPQLVVGWRMPGSQMGNFVRLLREAAGILLPDIAPNPSYREVVHSLVMDRFNSGKYATEMISDQSALELEKLQISALYLGQLRDYYELLERTALVLAVQVSMTADQQPLPDWHTVIPKK